MQFYLYKPGSNQISASTMMLDFHGVFLQYFITNFSASYGYTNFILIKNKVLEIASYGKKSRIGIMWGSYCGTPFYNKNPHVEFMAKAHQVNAEPIFKKYPVFYEEIDGKNPFLTEVENFLKWLAPQLDTIKEHIESISICGINKDTFEFRVADWDWTNTTNETEAYYNGALKWMNAGYTVEKCIQASRKLVSLHAQYFPTYKKVLRVIGGVSGFPTIDAKGICDKTKRPKINEELFDESKKYSNIYVETTAVKETPGSIPYSFDKIGLPIDLQLNFQTYGKDTMWQPLEGALANAYSRGCNSIEVYENNIKNFQPLIKKYMT